MTLLPCKSTPTSVPSRLGHLYEGRCRSASLLRSSHSCPFHSPSTPLSFVVPPKLSLRRCRRHRGTPRAPATKLITDLNMSDDARYAPFFLPPIIIDEVQPLLLVLDISDDALAEAPPRLRSRLGLPLPSQPRHRTPSSASSLTSLSTNPLRNPNAGPLARK